MWITGLGLGFANFVKAGGVVYVCLCLGCCSVGGEWVCGLDHGVVWWCSVYVSCESGCFVQIAGPYIWILC